MGPRGHGPIKQKCSLCQPSRFPNDMLGFWTCKKHLCQPSRYPNDILGFWTCKNLFVSPVGFQTTFWHFGHLKTYFGNTTPFCQPSGVPSGGLFREKRRPPNKIMRIYSKYEIVLQIFAILANVDLNLRLEICKIAIQSSVRTFTYPFVLKRRVSKSQYERIHFLFF